MNTEDTRLSNDGRWPDAQLSRRQFMALTSACALSAICAKVFAQSNEMIMLESRAILDEGLHWVVKDSSDRTTDRLCERIKRAGFNVFVPNIWHGRGTTWPTTLAPWDDRFPQPPGFDPLSHLIETARRYELEVHPWFNVGLRQRNFYPEFTSPVSNESFDFHNPAFRDFVVALILDVVNRYPVHGINLDFVRFDTPRPGFESVQEGAVVDVVRRVSRQAKAINPSIVVSVDAAPWFPEITQYGQNAPKWADEGLVDVIYSMQYQYNPDFEIIRQIQTKMKRPETLVVMVGNYDPYEISTQRVEPRSAKRLCDLIAESRMISTRNGVAVYFYGMLSEEQIELLQKTVFRVPAKPQWRLGLQPPSNVRVK